MAGRMRLVLGALLLAATGCPGEPIAHHCPADETCSALTDGNLVFHGAAVAGGRAGILYPTAIGGTQDISLEFRGEPFTAPYEVDDADGAGGKLGTWADIDGLRHAASNPTCAEGIVSRRGLGPPSPSLRAGATPPWTSGPPRTMRCPRRSGRRGRRI